MNKFIQINYFITWMMLLIMLLFLIYHPLHPMIISLMMILINSLSCTKMSLWKTNFIYSILIFLILTSGILVIIMYFSSIISNEQMNFNMKLNFLLLTILIIVFFSLLFPVNNFLLTIYSFSFLNINPLYNVNKNKFMNMYFIYSYPFLYMSMFMIFMMVITFFIVIKICSSSMSKPLRKIN